MKIAYLASSVLPSRSANSVHVMKMCSALASEGHEVKLYARLATSNRSSVYKYYGVDDSFEIFPATAGRISPARHIMSSVVDWIEFKPDLFYARYRPLAAIASLMPIPLVFEAHEIPRSLQAIWCEKIALRESKGATLVTISKVLAEDYIANGYTLKIPPIVAHDGANAAVVHPRIRQRGPLRVGYLGSLYPGKGMETILDIASRLENIEFHVVGGSEEDISFWRRKSELANVIYHGHVPHSETLRYLFDFDIALLPMQQRVSVDFNGSDIGRWTSPLKLFEYMGAKVPLIASRFPNIEEVIEDGRNGLLVDSTNIDEWVLAIERLQNSPQEGVAMSERAYSDILNCYSWEARARRIVGRNS